MKQIVLILATMLCGLTAFVQSANIDVDHIAAVSQVSTSLSVQQQHAWIVVQGYYLLHHSDGYLTLDVTDADNATAPLTPWFSCRTADGELSVVAEQDPEGDDEQFAAWDFPCPPTAEAWYFRLTLWVNDVPVDQEFFFSGVEHYRP